MLAHLVDLLRSMMGSGRRIYRQFSSVLTARVASAVVQAATLLLAARYSSVPEFGVLAAMLPVSGLVGTQADFGLQTHAVRLRAGESTRVGARRVLAMQTRLTGGIGLICVVTSLIAALWWSPGLLLAGAFMFAFLEKYTNGVIGVSIAEERTFVQIKLMVTARLATLSVMVLLLYFSDMSGVASFIVASCVGSFLATVVASRDRFLATPRGSLIGLSKELRNSRAYWVASLSGQLRTLDSTIVTLVGGAAVGGVYGVASRVANPFRLLGASLSAVALPAAARGDWHAVSQLKFVSGIGMLFGTLVAILAAFPLEPMIVFLIGPEYGAAAWPMAVLLAGVALNCGGALLSGIAQGIGASREVARMGVLLSIVTVACVVLGVFIQGALGAACGVLFVYALQLVLIRQVLKGKQQDV